VYVADNGWIQGPKADTHSLRSKRTPYEAGIRTPIMVRWPGQVRPQQSERLASSLDILPTLLAATRTPLPAGLPGINLLDDRALRGRQTLFGALFTHDAVDLEEPAANLMTRWIIDGDWKLMVPVPGQANEEQPQEIELYRIATDPEERQNLAAREPRRVAALQRQLDAWWPATPSRGRAGP
jgi:arylsulfatase A-like enzyme